MHTFSEIQLGPALVRWTDARHGDFGSRRTEPATPRAVELAAMLGIPSLDEVVRVRQVHGSTVVVATSVADSGQQGDALVTTAVGLPLAIETADCAPIALSAEEGVIAAVHAGWRGAVAGVLGSAAQAMRKLGATEIVAAVGPCIHSECYAFDADALQRLTTHYNDDVLSFTAEGTPALDLSAVIRHELTRADIALRYEDPSCTGCDARYFSFRKRQSPERQLMVVSLARAR